MPIGEGHFDDYVIDQTLWVSAGLGVHRAHTTGIEGFEKPVVLWCVEAENGAADVIEAARRMAVLSHSNIAQVLDAGQMDDGAFVATEYVPGVSLHRAAANVPLGWPVLVEVCAQVANALEYAHTRRDAEGRLLRIVHGHLSAARILLGTSGDIKLTGFGTPTDGASSLPEARGVRDGRDDVARLGAMLGKLLPADAPEEVGSILAAAGAELREHRPRAAAVRHALRRVLYDQGARVSSTTIAAVVAKAQTAAPSERPRIKPNRPASARELAMALEAIDPFEDLGRSFRLYTNLGTQLVEARAGMRGARALVAGLDLADSVGHDDEARQLCLILSQLCAQDGRLEESLEWRRRAAFDASETFARAG
ncbi:MAG: protein kinase [Myxococcota bacterium]